MSSLPLLSVRGVGKCFGTHRVLSDVSFDVLSGELHVLAGENGAGKSTLIKILAGIHGQDEGEIWFGGRKLELKGPAHARKLGLSVVHQELSLIDDMSVADNLFLGRERCLGPSGQWIDRSSQLRESERLCKAFGLEIDVRRAVGEFPIPVKSQIEIVKALIVDAADARGPRLLVLDEPTSALHAAEVERLFERIRELKARGFGLIYISHKMDEIYRLADRLTVLRDGRCVRTAPASELPREALIREMVGRELSERFPERMGEVVSSAVRLAVEGLSASGLSDVSLSVRAGEILGIGGLQGCGASQLLEAIFGVYGARAQGQVILDGRTVRIQGPRDAIAQGIGFLTNDRKATGLVLGSSIRENISLASLGELSVAGWIKRSRERALSQDFEGRLRIRCRSVEQEAATLSGGNQQKVALAKWLGTEPRVLLLDEPTRGVDVGAKQEIYEMIRELTGQGMAIVMASSEMPELLGMSDRVLVMHEGRVSAELSAQEATQEKVLGAALGLARAHSAALEKEAVQ